MVCLKHPFNAQLQSPSSKQNDLLLGERNRKHGYEPAQICGALTYFTVCGPSCTVKGGEDTHGKACLPGQGRVPELLTWEFQPLPQNRLESPSDSGEAHLLTQVRNMMFIKYVYHIYVYQTWVGWRKEIGIINTSHKTRTREHLVK